MFERLERSWGLVKASASILMKDQSLLIFPFISGISVLVVVACFALQLGGLGALDGLSGADGKSVSTAHYVAAFLFYLSQYFVIFFFNTALVGAVMLRLDGGTPTVGDGLRIAASKLYPILGYAFIAATVGMLLRAIQERVGFVGQIVVGLLGMGWTLATYMVVPVLATRDVGPFEAITESAELLKKTWGESVIGQAGLGAAFGLIYFGVMICGMLLVAMAVSLHSVALIVMTAIFAIGAILLTTLVHAALSGIYAAALYRYATDSQNTQGFDAHALKSAFVPAG
jgi:Family of unknown function (DUF6159)